jgi:hypothetical protein
MGLVGKIKIAKMKWDPLASTSGSFNGVWGVIPVTRIVHTSPWVLHLAIHFATNKCQNKSLAATTCFIAESVELSNTS